MSGLISSNKSGEEREDIQPNNAVNILSSSPVKTSVTSTWTSAIGCHWDPTGSLVHFPFSNSVNSNQGFKTSHYGRKFIFCFVFPFIFSGK